MFSLDHFFGQKGDFRDDIVDIVLTTSDELWENDGSFRQ